MMTVISVDFKNRKVVESQCVPRRETWSCDCCGKSFTRIENASNNMHSIVLSKDTTTPTGKSAGKVNFRICRSCCEEIGKAFEE